MSFKFHRHYKWELLFWLCLAFFFHQGDRAIYGVVLSGIKSDLGLTDLQLGMVGSVLFLMLALAMPFAALVGDAVKKNWIITCSLIFWSSATLFTGCAQGILGLILLRSVATAGGEAFYAPAAYPLMAKFHQRTRAMALSLHQGALYVGVMTSGFLGGWIAQNWGWRSAFYVFGGCGILLGLVFIFRLRDSIETTEKARPSNVSALLKGVGVLLLIYISLGCVAFLFGWMGLVLGIIILIFILLRLEDSSHAACADKPQGISVRSLLQGLVAIVRIPTALMLTTGLTAIVFVNNGFMVWAPEFLREKADLSLTLAGGYSMFWHHLPALIGISIGGPLSDRWVLKRNTARLELQAVAMALGVPSIVLMALAPNLTIACVGLALFGLFRGLYESNTHAAMFDVIEHRHRASAVAISVMLAFLVGSTSPWLLGKSREMFGNAHGLSYGFAALSVAYLIGAGAVTIARLMFFKRDRINEEA